MGSRVCRKRLPPASSLHLEEGRLLLSFGLTTIPLLASSWLRRAGIALKPGEQAPWAFGALWPASQPLGSYQVECAMRRLAYGIWTTFVVTIELKRIGWIWPSHDAFCDEGGTLHGLHRRSPADIKAIMLGSIHRIQSRHLAGDACGDSELAWQVVRWLPLVSKALALAERSSA